MATDTWRHKAAALREWAKREPDMETCRLLLGLADEYDEVAGSRALARAD